MSASLTHRVVEWSPAGVVGFDPATKQFTKADSLSELAGTYGGGSIIAAVSRRSTFVKAVRVPNAGASEINMILQTQMATMFPVPLHELAYAFRLSDDINAEGRLAIVAAMRESDLQSLYIDAKAGGLKVERVIPAAFGSMLLADSLGHKNAAVVQETSEGLAIDLVAEGELRYSRVAPMPANSELIEAEVERSFQGVGLSSAPIVAAGGFPFAQADQSTNVSTLEALATLPMEKIGLSLETRETRDSREKARQGSRTRLAVFMCAAAGLLALLVFVERSEAAEKLRVSNAKWQKELSGRRTDATRLEGEVAKLQATVQTLKRAFAPAQLPADVFTTVSNHAPKNLWLTGTTFERGKIMYVRGTSATSEALSDYLQELTTEPRLRDVKLVFANNAEIEKTPVVQFSIQAFPVGNLPLVDPKKKGAKK
ncbi:MAG: PilN domain-containing protein [Chlorobia bacterium]|nr:PilN domain-containing protein [Fimbriimonadaceae bacterium]